MLVAAFEWGTRGVQEDPGLMVNPWGFRPQPSPTFIWQGSTGTFGATLAMALPHAEIPLSQLTLLPKGHLSVLTTTPPPSLPRSATRSGHGPG